MGTANCAPGLAQIAELGLGDLGMDSEKRKLPVPGWREGESLDEISDDVAWFLDCLQVSGIYKKIYKFLCAYTYTQMPHGMCR